MIQDIDMRLVLREGEGSLDLKVTSGQDTLFEDHSKGMPEVISLNLLSRIILRCFEEGLKRKIDQLRSLERGVY